MIQTTSSLHHAQAPLESPGSFRLPCCLLYPQIGDAQKRAASLSNIFSASNPKEKKELLYYKSQRKKS